MFAMYTPWETLENLWFTLPHFPLRLPGIPGLLTHTHPDGSRLYQKLKEKSTQIFCFRYLALLIIT